MLTHKILDMKHILITICIFIATITVNAQEHLSFKGIPIEGSISSFCQKLKAKGLVQVHSEDNMRLFVGDFTGRDATIGVIADQTGENVFSVVVFFPESEEWNTLVSTYDYYKDLYTEKYGTPSFNKEYNPSRMNDNMSLMREVYQGTVVYGSVFNAPGGTIELSIAKADGIYSGQVVIRYQDSQNSEEKRKSDLDDI